MKKRTLPLNPLAALVCLLPLATMGQSSATPSISATAPIGGWRPFATTLGNPSPAQQGTIQGRNLSAGITISAPAGYQVAIQSSAGPYAGSVTIPRQGTSVPGRALWVRLSGDTTGAVPGTVTVLSGVISVSSAGANTATIQVTGEVRPKPTPLLVMYPDPVFSPDEASTRWHDTNAFYEGNAGERRLLRFIVELKRPPEMSQQDFDSFFNDNTVSGLVTVREGKGPIRTVGPVVNRFGVVQGYPLRLATTQVDFEEFRGFPMTFARSNFFTVTVLGDNEVEDHEAFEVVISNIAGLGTQSSVTNASIIFDDDRPPEVRLNPTRVSASEPVGRTNGVKFNAELAYPFPRPVTLDFETRDGPSPAATSSANGRDYFANSGALEIPANTNKGTISVTLNQAETFGSEPAEKFHILVKGREDSLPAGADIVGEVLSGPSPWSRPIMLFQPRRGGATAECAILNTRIKFVGTGPERPRPGFLPVGIVGAFQFGPDKEQLEAEKKQIFNLTWTVPEGKKWRDLRSLDVRVREGNNAAIWLRWDEATNQFVLVESAAVPGGKRSKLPDLPSGGEPYGEPSLPGAETELGTGSATLHLAGCKVTGSGPSGLTASLDFALSFKDTRKRRLLNVELAATDDSGNEDAFVRAGSLMVNSPGRR